MLGEIMVESSREGMMLCDVGGMGNGGLDFRGSGGL